MATVSFGGDKMFIAKVPASSANLGPGFDCMGIALKLYCRAEFEEIDSGFEIEVVNEGNGYVPQNENNLVYKAMQSLYVKAGKELSGIRVRLDSDIPVTRGLGSSSAAIVAGLVGANHLLGNMFSEDELLYEAYEIEGHPDNVTPALLGGFTISFPENGRIIRSKTVLAENIKFAAILPNFYLPTRKSRGYLPDFTKMKNAVYNISRASMLSAALVKGDTELLSHCFRDRIHQKYRFPHIKSGEYIIRAAKRLGASGGYISGAGPTIMSVVSSNYEEFELGMNKLIKTNLPDWRLVMLEADNDGAVIEKKI